MFIFKASIKRSIKSLHHVSDAIVSVNFIGSKMDTHEVKRAEKKSGKNFWGIKLNNWILA